MPAPPQSNAGDTDWPVYGGNLAYWRYQALDQINAANFNQLQVAWQFKTDNLGFHPEFILQCTPLLIGGRLFATAGSRRDVVCLDAATGEVLWLHKSPDEGARARNSPRQYSGRGVGYWRDGDEERILYVTIGYQLMSLDAKTGLPDPNFGAGGMVDLKLDDDQDMDLDTADIGLHSAPTIAKGVVIIGAAHTAGNTPQVKDNAKGYVRGFDVRRPASGSGSSTPSPRRASSATTPGCMRATRKRPAMPATGRRFPPTRNWAWPIWASSCRPATRWASIAPAPTCSAKASSRSIS